MVPAGQLVGALLSAAGCSLLGRRPTTVLAATVSLCGSAGLAALGQSGGGGGDVSSSTVAGAVLCFRLLCGVGMGASGASHPMYVFELCGGACHWRGTLNGSGPVCVTLGILVAFVLGTIWGWQVTSWSRANRHFTKYLA